MSLVNDMLRDLDQRRKETGGSSGAVRLTPASEYASDSRKILLPLVLFGLVLASGAIWYYWTQLSQSGNEQRLDIQLQPSLVEATPASEVIATDTNETISQASTSIALQPSVVELANNEPVATATPESITARTEQPAPVNNNIVQPTAEPVVSPPISAALELDAVVISEGEPEIVDAVELAETAIPDLLDNNISESIKDAPEYTTEQRDTIAVQEALQLISSGKTIDAYAILGEHIASNRYAHQSRETYAKLLMSRGGVEEAYALVEAGLALAPNHRGFKKVKARLLMANGLIGEAVDILISRAPDVTEDAEYHDLLASAQLSSKDYEGAVISYKGLVQTDQSQGKWWYGFAASQDALGNFNAARQAYLQAIQYSNLSANLRRRSQERLGVLSP